MAHLHRDASQPLATMRTRYRVLADHGAPANPLAVSLAPRGFRAAWRLRAGELPPARMKSAYACRSGTLHHYYVAVNGQNNIYMATYVGSAGEVASGSST